ncbi:MAG TPA: response regulator transcription factor [Candidatus Enterenecus avicola]|nr:response regulator transcription factor [Candidatus Enterenecus avicola]
MQSILLVEDDKHIVDNLTDYLEGEGFRVRSAEGQAQALERLEGERFDLVLLDISLSDGNGFAVCSAVKALYQLPVIFLTASGDEYSTVTGFEVGADDYIPKPFRPRELLMRIKNVLRRTSSGGGLVRLGPVEVDTVRGRATKDGQDLNLSALEYRLLLMFLNHPGAVLTRSQLLEGIWDIAGDFVNDNTLTVYIKRLREKIEDDPQSPTLIKTVRGMGYKAEMG